MFVKGLYFCYFVICFTCTGQSHDYPNRLERSHGTFEGTFAFNDAKLQFNVAQRSPCFWNLSGRRRSTNRSSGITLCRISSENLVALAGWFEDTREVRFEESECKGWRLWFLHIVWLRITAVCCVSLGLPNNHQQSSLFSHLGTEFLREIATLRDEARVRGDPEKCLGEGSLSYSNLHHEKAHIWWIQKAWNFTLM